MTSASRWSRQSIVSSILLAILCTLGLSIFVVHERTKDSVFSAYTLTGNEQNTSGSAAPAQDFPLDLPAGFSLAAPPEHYTAENLYEKINGKAPLYLEAGFSSLTTRRFVLETDPALWFELYIYDMGSPRNAFSVYSTQRRTETSAVASLQAYDHYATENGLYLRLGSLYIECIGSAAAPVLARAMTAIGRQLAAAAPAVHGAIKELQLFPKQDLAPASFKLILNNSFGSEALRNTYIAKYRVNGQPVTAFISPADNPNQAARTAEQYLQFLLESDGIPDENITSMHVIDLYGLLEIVFSVGPYVAGIHEGEQRAEALEIAERLKISLTEIQNRGVEPR